MANSTDAELAGIANAVHVAAKGALLRPEDVLLIQCDNVNALAQIRRHLGATDNPAKLKVGIAGPVISPIQREAVEFLRATADPLGLRFVVRHVKGHTSNDDGRSWVNSTCDAIARGHMRKMRAQLSGQTQ